MPACIDWSATPQPAGLLGPKVTMVLSFKSLAFILFIFNLSAHVVL
jgi:hypothetical protein